MRESTSSILPTYKSEHTKQSEPSNYSWKTLAKAGLVFVTTTGAFLVLKTTGSFGLISSWLKNKGTDFDEQETNLAISGEAEGMEAYSGHLDFKESSLTLDEDTHKGIAFMPQKGKRGTTEILEKIGSEFLVNTYTINDQEYPSVAGLTDGKFVVTWTSIGGQDGSGDGVYGQIFNADGSKYDSEFQVNTYYTISQQRYSSVASLNNGKFVVMWESNGQDGSNYGIYGQMFNANGSKYLSEFLVNTCTVNDQRNPSVVHLNNGKFVIMWQSAWQDGSGWGIYGQIYNADGTKYLSEFQVNTYTPNYQNSPSVAGLSDSKFVVTWESDGQDGSNYGIYGQMFNANGSKYLSEFLVNTHKGNFQSGSSIAGLSDGKFVVVWQSYGQDSSFGWGIYSQMYNTDGSKFGSEFQVNTYTTSDQEYPSVIGLSDGKFVVTWQSDGQDGNGWGIYGQMYNINGTKFLSEFLVNTYTVGTQICSAIASLPDSKFVVTWICGWQDGSYEGVCGQMFSVNEILISSYLSSSQQIPKSSSTVVSSSTVTSILSSSTTTPISSTEDSSFVSVKSEVSSRSKEHSSTSSESQSTRQSKTSVSVPKSTSKEITSTQAFSGSSSSATTSAGKSRLSTIIGSIGGIVGIITSVLGVWLKYKKYRAITKLRQQSLLAAEVQKHLNLDVSDFQSKQGQRYVAVINGIVETLRQQGMPVEEMDKEQLHDLTLSSVEVIKGEVEPNKAFLRKTIPVKGLKKAKDLIIKEVVNKYIKGKDKDGIMLQSIKSEEADIEGKSYGSEGGIFGVRDVQRIQQNDLKFEGDLGDGSFGRVYKATWLGSEVAVKVLKEGIAELPEFMGDFIREAATWSKLTHPNITRFYGICWTKPSPYIVVEYVGGGSLASHLKKKDLTLTQRLGLGLDTVRGVRYLHEYKPPIWHRDIKPDNVLIEYTWNQTNEQWLLRGKVTDFGTAKQKILNRTEKALTKGVGTPLYQAPEIIKGSRNYSEKADVYSTGIYLCEIYTQKEPYSDQSELSNQFKFFKAITEKGIRPTIPDEMSKGYAALIKQCWSERPSKRPRIEQVEEQLKPIVDEVARECPVSP